MLSRVLVLVISIGAGACFFGCGKSDEEAEPIALEELPARYAEIYCKSVEPCCAAQGFSHDPTQCRQQVQSYVQGQLAELDTSRVGYDPELAGECMAAVAGTVVCGRETRDLDDTTACEGMLFGLVEPGGACNDSDECKHGAHQRALCEGDDEQQDGVCVVTERVVLARGKLGGACAQTCDLDDSCESFGIPAPGGAPAPQPAGSGVACYLADNLYCSLSSTCQPLGKLGEPCESYDGCESGSFCDFDTQVCTRPGPDGAACESRDQCSGGICDYGEDGTLAGTCASTRRLSQRSCSGMLGG